MKLKKNARLKLPPNITTCVPITIVVEIIDTPTLAANKTIKIL